MAARYGTHNRRTAELRRNGYGQFYVYGNAVRQTEPIPKKTPEARPKQPKQMSRQEPSIEKNPATANNKGLIKKKKLI